MLVNQGVLRIPELFLGLELFWVWNCFEKSIKSKKQRSKETEKQENAEKQSSRPAGKSGEAKKQGKQKPPRNPRNQPTEPNLIIVRDSQVFATSIPTILIAFLVSLTLLYW